MTEVYYDHVATVENDRRAIPVICLDQRDFKIFLQSIMEEDRKWYYAVFEPEQAMGRLNAKTFIQTVHCRSNRKYSQIYFNVLSRIHKES